MDIKGYEKLNSRAKEIAFRKAMDAAEQHLCNVLKCLDNEDILAMGTHVDNAVDEFIDLQAMALFAKFEDPKKWWEFWR